jgi:hypothetical protein
MSLGWSLGFPDLTRKVGFRMAVTIHDHFMFLEIGGCVIATTREHSDGSPCPPASMRPFPQLHEHQARGFDGTTVASTGRKLDELAATLARGKTRHPRGKAETEIERITHDGWVRRVTTWQLAGMPRRAGAKPR